MWWIKRWERIVVVKIEDILADNIEKTIVNNLVLRRFKFHPYVMWKVKNSKEIILKTVVKSTKII
jgi:hypothetical protein